MKILLGMALILAFAQASWARHNSQGEEDFAQPEVSIQGQDKCLAHGGRTKSIETRNYCIFDVENFNELIGIGGNDTGPCLKSGGSLALISLKRSGGIQAYRCVLKMRVFDSLFR